MNAPLRNPNHLLQQPVPLPRVQGQDKGLQDCRCRTGLFIYNRSNRQRRASRVHGQPCDVSYRPQHPRPTVTRLSARMRYTRHHVAHVRYMLARGSLEQYTRLRSYSTGLKMVDWRKTLRMRALASSSVCGMLGLHPDGRRGRPHRSWTPRELQERPPLWGQLQRTWARTPHPARRTEADRPHQHRQQNRQPWHRRREPARIPMAQTARRAEPWEADARSGARGAGSVGSLPVAGAPAGLSERSQGALPRSRRLGRGARQAWARVSEQPVWAMTGLRRRRGRRRYRCCFSAASRWRSRMQGPPRTRVAGPRYRSPCRWRMLLMLRSRRAPPSRT